MVELVLEHRSSLYFRRQKKFSCWHLKVKNPSPGFTFPPWVEIKGLWRQVAPHSGELMCRCENSGHLVFSVQAKSMTAEAKSRFLEGFKKLLVEEKGEANA